MSQENGKLFHRATDAFNRRDLDTYLALTDPDIEIGSLLVAVEGGYHGHDGVRRWWRDLLQASPDFTVEVVDVRDLGDVTLARMQARGRGAGSEILVEQTLWFVVRWRADKAIWTSVLSTEKEAFEAARLTK